MPILSWEIIPEGIRSHRSELIKRAVCADTWAPVALKVTYF